MIKNDSSSHNFFSVLLRVTQKEIEAIRVDHDVEHDLCNVKLNES